MIVRSTVLVVSLLAAEAEGPRSFGDVRRVVRDHDVAPKVTLGAVLESPHAYGLGSLSELRGEIVIIDGKAWLSYPPRSLKQTTLSTDNPFSEPIRVKTEGVADEKAAFLVATHVDPAAWTKVELPEGLSSKNLEATLIREARAHGLKDRDLVFRATGTFETLTLAIVDGRRFPPGPGSEEILKAANVTLQVSGGGTGELVGFYTRANESPFTHPGSHAHTHAVVPRGQRGAAGHAQEFVMKPGAVLWLRATKS
jgi:acetolactate decarboxylase